MDRTHSPPVLVVMSCPFILAEKIEMFSFTGSSANAFYFYFLLNKLQLKEFSSTADQSGCSL